MKHLPRLANLLFPRRLLVSGKSLPLPVGWGDDPLSGFLDQAQRNTQFLFDRHREGFEKLSGIDRAFETVARNPPPGFTAFLLLKCHSAFRAAVRVASSGQIPEAYAVLRLALEWALYAAYIHGDEERARRWLGRHDSEDAEKAVIGEFKSGRLLVHLSTLSPAVGGRASDLYKREIELGAHPNERALTAGIRPEQAGTWQVDYFTPQNSLPLQLALKTSAQVGVCCLEIFELLYPERFKLIGLSDELVGLRKGL